MMLRDGRRRQPVSQEFAVTQVTRNIFAPGHDAGSNTEAAETWRTHHVYGNHLEGRPFYDHWPLCPRDSRDEQ
jgi:hypothetical protein